MAGAGERGREGGPFQVFVPRTPLHTCARSCAAYMSFLPPPSEHVASVAARSPRPGARRSPRSLPGCMPVPSPLGRVQCDWQYSLAPPMFPPPPLRSVRAAPRPYAFGPPSPPPLRLRLPRSVALGIGYCRDATMATRGANFLPRVGAGVRAGLRGDRLRMLCLCVARHAAGWLRGWAWTLYTVYRANHRHPGLWRCGIRSSPI